MEGGDRGGAGRHERVADRGPLEGAPGVFGRPERLYEHAERLRGSDPAERAQRRDPQRRAAVRRERGDGVDGVRRAQAPQGGQGVTSHVAALIPQREDQRR